MFYEECKRVEEKNKVHFKIIKETMKQEKHGWGQNENIYK